MMLHLACYLGQQLVVDVSRHVGPGLHHLAAGLLPPHGVGVHPLAVSAAPPDPGLRAALVAGQVVVVHREVAVLGEQLGPGRRPPHQKLEFDSLSIKPLLRVGDPELVRHGLGQPPHLHLEVRGVVDDFVVGMSNPSVSNQVVVLHSHADILGSVVTIIINWASYNL